MARAENLGVGIIGIGRIGEIHARNLQRMQGVAVRSIADADTRSEKVAYVKGLARELGIANVVTDSKRLIEDPKVHAVFICSPTATHPQLIKDIADAGKDIFCEKPVSFSVDETREAVEYAEEKGAKLQIGFHRRFDPEFARVKKAIDTGEIGEPCNVVITSRDPAPPGKNYLTGSGGIFLDMAIHDFDMARHLAGREVDEVFASGAALISDEVDELGDADTANINLKYEDGSLGIVIVSRDAAGFYDQRIEVFGERGSLRSENKYPNTVEVFTPEGVKRDLPEHFFPHRYVVAYNEEVKAFVASVREESEPPVTGWDGLAAEQIALAAKKSFETDMPVLVEDLIHE